MAKLVDRLTDLKVRKLREPGLYADGAGLYLQVRGEAARSWVYRYRLDGKSREMGLGSYPAVTLDAARLKRDEQKALKQQNTDPIDKRRTETGLRLKNITFAAAAADYISAKAPGWKSPKSRGQWASSLKTYIEPTFGDLPVRHITTELILRVLTPLWSVKAETASRLRGRIELILEYAKSLGYREGENPARWRGNLEHSLAKPSDVREVMHHPALPFLEIPTFMEKLRAEASTTARALEFIILTAARASEGLGGVPQEIIDAERTWIIPRARMKAKQAHRVPLVARALEVVGLVVRDEHAAYLFPGLRPGRPLSDAALRLLLGRLGYGHVTTHGFRATFRTWAGERTNFPREVVERALAHSIGDRTEEAYNRGDAFEKRRKLMEAWAGYCASKPVEKRNNNVTSIGEARKVAAG